MLKGKIKSHVQPDYADIKQRKIMILEQMKCVKDFLQFYEPVGPRTTRLQYTLDR